MIDALSKKIFIKVIKYEFKLMVLEIKFYININNSINYHSEPYIIMYHSLTSEFTQTLVWQLYLYHKRYVFDMLQSGVIRIK